MSNEVRHLLNNSSTLNGEMSHFVRHDKKTIVSTHSINASGTFRLAWQL
jgi:hypothetical protein